MLDPLGVLIHWESMQRLTARFLLLFALLGTFVPIALQATTAPAHACCRRNGSHHCSDSLGGPLDEPVLRDAACCNHDCCRAVTTSHWASPQPWAWAVVAQKADGRVTDLQASAPATLLFISQSTRAPPAC